MIVYPNLKNEDVELLKIKTRDDEIKNLKYQTEKHDHENILKSLKVDNEYYKKKYKSLNKKKVLLIITEILIGSGSAITSSTFSFINPSVGIPIASCSALLTSLAILITNDINKLKLRYTKLRDWINFITILYEKTLNQSMIDKKIDEKEALELKKIYNHYIDKRKEIMDSTKIKVEDIFGSDVISKDSISPEQITKLNNFLAELM